MIVLNKLLLLSALSLSPMPVSDSTTLPSGLDMENVLNFVERYNPADVFDDSLIGEHSFRISAGLNSPSEDYLGDADENISYSFLPDYSSFSILNQDGTSFSDTDPYYFQPITSNKSVVIGSTSLVPDHAYSLSYDLFFTTHYHSALISTPDGLSVDEDFVLESSGDISFSPSSSKIKIDDDPIVSHLSNENRVYNFSVSAPPAPVIFENVSRSLVSVSDPSFFLTESYPDYTLGYRSIPGSSASMIFDIYENGELISTVNPAVSQNAFDYDFSYEVSGVSKPVSSKLEVSYYDNFYAQKVSDKY